MTFKTFNDVTKYAASSVACSLYRIQGYYRGTVDAWLQIHDTTVEPAAGAVPLKSYALPYNAAFHWGFDAAPLSLTTGCFIAVSSDPDVYTEVTYVEDVTSLDLEGDLSPYEHDHAYTEKGDDDADVGYLVLWTNSGKTSKLHKVKYTNGSGAAAWLMFFATAPSEGERPLALFGGKDGVADAATLNLDFGAAGFRANKIEGLDGTSGTTYYGGILYESSTGDTYTDPGVNTSVIHAYITTDSIP